MADERLAAFEAFLKTAVTETDGHRVTIRTNGKADNDAWVVTHYDTIGLFAYKVGHTHETKFFPWHTIAEIY